MNMTLGVLISIIAILLYIFYKRWSRVFNYWKERGLPHKEPYPIIGNFLPFILKKKSFGEVLTDLGNDFKDEPLIGFYSFAKPAVLINDPSYAETVMIKEFSSFMNRREVLNLKEMRAMDKNLFFISDAAWKGVRSKMLPIFTTNKLKSMIPQMEKLFDKVSDHVDRNIDKSIKMKELVELYTMCVRANCVYGYDVTNTTMKSNFMKKVKQLSKFNIVTAIESFIFFQFPRFANRFNFSFFGRVNEEYFSQAFVRALNSRIEKGDVKPDLLQALIELKCRGKVEVSHWLKDDDYIKMDEKYLTTESIEIDDDILVAQGVIFLLAGFDPILLADIMTLFELTQNREILEKLRTEVDNVINKYKEFSYQALKEMHYLDLCIKETSRLYTAADIVLRQCNKTYTFDNGFTVEKGTEIFIPLIKFHMDSKYFPEPHLYRPERFENLDLPICAYIPFGEGPRICIGMRFALMEMKMFLSKMVYHYDFSLDPRTQLPLSFEKWHLLRRVTTPIHLKITRRIPGGATPEGRGS